MRDFTVLTTASVLVAIWGVSQFSSAFVPSVGYQSNSPLRCEGHVCSQKGFDAQPANSMRATLGLKGLFAFGLSFGLMAAASRASTSTNRMARRAETKPAVVEKYDLSKTYLANLPRTILDETTLNKLMSTVPKEQWDKPPEDSYLFMLKMYAETYGEGKATRMGWWDYWYMKINAVEGDEFYTGPDLALQEKWQRDKAVTGELPLWLPVTSWVLDTGATIKWRGPEHFAGDQCQTPVNASLFAKQFIKAWAFYRDGLKPWQRGLEIGLAHGYFLIGPFVSLGPLRNTPEAATVGLLCGIATVGIVTTGGLMFSKVMKPTLFDKDGEKEGTGFNEVIAWHGLGGIGGAAFAHSLISVFGS